MSKPKPLSRFANRHGTSLFVFEPGKVRIFGEKGSEAAVPLEDLTALLEYLDETEEPPPLPMPPGLSPEDDPD